MDFETGSNRTKVQNLIGDNVSNNDTLTESLKTYMPSFREESRVRCMPHIICLTAKVC